MTERDHFAAAALTGLCSMPPMSGPDKPHDFAAMAYAYADAMLRERSRAGQNSSEGTDSAAKCTERDSANHDAAPAARASEAPASPERVRVRGDAGTGDTPTTHATRGEGSERREGTEPVAWALMRHGKAEQVAVHPVYLSGDIHRVAPLYAYQPPMLTAAERDAIQTAMNAYGSDNANPECAAIEATLWGLLERTK